MLIGSIFFRAEPSFKAHHEKLEQLRAELSFQAQNVKIKYWYFVRFFAVDFLWCFNYNIFSEEEVEEENIDLSDDFIE